MCFGKKSVTRQHHMDISQQPFIIMTARVNTFTMQTGLPNPSAEAAMTFGQPFFVRPAGSEPTDGMKRVILQGNSCGDCTEKLNPSQLPTVIAAAELALTFITATRDGFLADTAEARQAEETLAPGDRNPYTWPIIFVCVGLAKVTQDLLKYIDEDPAFKDLPKYFYLQKGRPDSETTVSTRNDITVYYPASWPDDAVRKFETRLMRVVGKQISDIEGFLRKKEAANRQKAVIDAKVAHKETTKKAKDQRLANHKKMCEGPGLIGNDAAKKLRELSLVAPCER